VPSALKGAIIGYPNAVDRRPRLISMTLVAYSLRTGEDIPLERYDEMIGSIRLRVLSRALDGTDPQS
jgi:hypothetical protein